MSKLSDRELLEDLGVDVTPKKQAKFTPKQERIIAGFEEIQQFVEEHGHEPRHGEELDIFERLYAVRLEQIRGLAEAEELLGDMDHQNLLNVEVDQPADDLSDDELLADLGIEVKADDLGVLKHVTLKTETGANKESPDKIAARIPCEDFHLFEDLFLVVQADIEQGFKETRPVTSHSNIHEHDLYILRGQKAYVAEKGEEYINSNNNRDARLRVIFDNGTESDLLMRSLQKVLNEDTAGRQIVDKGDAGPLFSDELEAGDIVDGTVYIARSQSTDPFITANREVVHKIGVTGGSVARRIADAQNEPTYLYAKVDIVAEYQLANINRTRFENALHRIFAQSRLSITLKDGAPRNHRPREWFVVPLPVIKEAIERIMDGSITNYIYDISNAKLVQAR